MMEGDDIELSEEELQKWIREKLKRNELMLSGVLEKCNLLQSLLKRRENQAAHLLQLCQSVSACEAIVKKQYSLLGWKYRDTDSDDDDDEPGCGNTVPSSPTTNGCTLLLPKLQDSENLHRDNGQKNSLKREPVVVLTRLSRCKIRCLRKPTPKNYYSQDECSSFSDSDKQWEPSDDLSDSDYSVSSHKTGPNKRRKLHETNKKPDKSRATAQADSNAEDKSSVTETSPPEASANTDAMSSRVKSPTPPTNTNGVSPVCITAFCQAPDNATKTPPAVPQAELNVNMRVLARRRTMTWQPGKITEIVTKENGRLKYKIKFEKKGKSLVSGHHIAFDYMSEVEQLYVGARVVVEVPADQGVYQPGVLGELPTRRNHMRYLVFLDDHKPVYVSLSLLRLVCRPLADPLDDLPDGFHKNFMKVYMKAWPYPPLIQYRVGQIFNVELNGVLRRCEVQLIDCSMIQVLLLTDQSKKWIYRGSTCLEHMIHINSPLEAEKDEGQEKKSP